MVKPPIEHHQSSLTILYYPYELMDLLVHFSPCWFCWGASPKKRNSAGLAQLLTAPWRFQNHQGQRPSVFNEWAGQQIAVQLNHYWLVKGVSSFLDKPISWMNMLDSFFLRNEWIIDRSPLISFVSPWWQPLGIDSQSNHKNTDQWLVS